VYGLEDSVRYVLEEMKQHGPYDGFLTFSQGSIFVRHMYRVMHDIDKKTYEKELETSPFPRLLISVAGLYFPYMLIDYKGTQYPQSSYTYPIDSVHIYGQHDEYKEFMTEHTLFTKDPLVLYHDEGHKFPRVLTDDDFAKLKTFLRNHWIAKYGDSEGFVVTKDHYCF
jgi:hypothetical protein